MMKRRIAKAAFVLGVGMMMTACANQPLAPIVTGYDKTGPRKAPQYAKVSKAEPLAATVSAPLKDETVTSAWPRQRAQMQSQTAQPPVAPAIQMISHTAKPTDTLYKIATQYDSSVAGIIKANQLKDVSDFKPGQTLTVPAHSHPRVSALNLVRGMLEGKPSVPEAPKVQQIAVGDEQPLAKIEPAAGPQQVASLTGPAGRAPQTALPAAVALQSEAPSYITHAVQPKETIFRISQTYKVSVLDIMAANAFDTPQDLKAGTLVKVPVAPKQTAQTPMPQQAAAPVALSPAVAKVEPKPAPQAEPQSATPPKTASVFEKPKPKTEKDAIVAELKRGMVDEDAAQTAGMVWPVRGKVLQNFGDAPNGVSYTGIAIAVPAGTNVLASDAGTVLYADDGLKAYGKMVLIRHGNGMVSAYAHNSYLLVKKGEKVKKGQVIAASGASGNVAAPQLHFELRQHASAIDPLRMLPKL